ncbi:hypothetical protein A3Q56_07456 [Intoshia linei]|uniref:Ribosomal RNA-processing protein 42 n=1 Tax=Intoshia linei TaxID=1819745 RepID=A0A177AS77_9BILA|nr:hypothetical protein A3Q56_07456 [Intoshia linei]
MKHLYFEHKSLISDIEKYYIINGIKNDVRQCGRSKLEFRSIDEQVCNTSAFSSLELSCGNSTIHVDVNGKLKHLGEQNKKDPEFTFNVTVSPLVNYPPSETEIEFLTKLLSSTYEKSEIYKQFIIAESYLLWNLLIDVIIISNDGNIFDLTFQTIYRALSACVMPKINCECKYKIQQDVLMNDNYVPIHIKSNYLSAKSVLHDFTLSQKNLDTWPIDTKSALLCLTFNIVGELIIFDASLSEEICSIYRIFVVFEPSTMKIVSIRSFGVGSIATDVMVNIIKESKQYISRYVTTCN